MTANQTYRNIVFNRLKLDLIDIRMIAISDNIRLGLAVGKVYQRSESRINKHLAD